MQILSSSLPVPRSLLFLSFMLTATDSGHRARLPLKLLLLSCVAPEVALQGLKDASGLKRPSHEVLALEGELSHAQGRTKIGEGPQGLAPAHPYSL